MILKKHLINLYEGDYEKLANLELDLKPSEIIRELVRKFIESQVEEAVASEEEVKL